MATGKWNIPDDVLESLARCFLPDIIAFYETEEGQKYFAQWKAEREKKNSVDTGDKFATLRAKQEKLKNQRK